MVSKLKTLLHTVMHLKPTQIYHQIWYRVKKKLGRQDAGLYSYDEVANKDFTSYISHQDSYLGDNKFRFINLEHQFDKIDWNYGGHAKLWAYNLNYFDYLHQSNIDQDEALKLLHLYISDSATHTEGKEPYPTSLRIINIVKFALAHKIDDKKINDLVATDAYRLSKNLEYHLLANHLLENAFALFFAGKYLQNNDVFDKGQRLLKEQLDEQIMDDGAHYELSPMYHQLMLYRVLDSIQLIDDSHALYDYLVDKAQNMAGWLEQITFQNGDIPLVNDSAFGINPTTEELLDYLKYLGLKPNKNTLSDSGYRMISEDDYECFVDVGNVSPSYQPGHTHADSLSFVLYKNGSPFIVDTGTSTYNIGAIRTRERATSSHNTVVANGKNSSQVWSGFRVAKRASTQVLEERDGVLSAAHNGYPGMHKRKWEFHDDKVHIHDALQAGDNKAYLHLHPDVEVEDIIEGKVNTSMGTIAFRHYSNIKLLDYEFAPRFNIYIRAKKIEVTFDNELETTIHI